ncbi:hypothetical protein [Halobacillus sp. Marseille-P3879]|uniref:hypothetical protein n=1 Tax=Halobacillus sp. Marseille-P3879 TaxID=2045014 RepID=UPI000C7AD50B|nr:hypothetical protein [Halobacillus sp. Marseille-P3879]
MFTLRDAIGMRLEDIQEEKKYLRETIKQLTMEQQELIDRLERIEGKEEENIDDSADFHSLVETVNDGKVQRQEFLAHSSIEKESSELPPEASQNEYILPTDPSAFSSDRSKSMTYKELTHILINYAKEHNNQVDHEEFEKYLIDHYHFNPENFSHIIWRARKQDRRLRSVISGNRKITILDNSEHKDK